MEQHNDDIQHNGLHTVESDEMVEFLVLDYGQEHDEEYYEGRKLARKVYLGQWACIIISIRFFCYILLLSLSSQHKTILFKKNCDYLAQSREREDF